MRNPSQRNDLQKELQEVDTELDEKEKELTKLRVIAQEVNPLFYFVWLLLIVAHRLSCIPFYSVQSVSK